MNKDISFKNVEDFATFVAVMEVYQINYHIFEEVSGWKVRILGAKI